jgi:hypothetical protein
LQPSSYRPSADRREIVDKKNNTSTKQFTKTITNTLTTSLKAQPHNVDHYHHLKLPKSLLSLAIHRHDTLITATRHAHELTHELSPLRRHNNKNR